MKKLKQKSNAKPVGAGLVPAQNKGITLIALIITIIVMLILVGVTINVALNGGLFEKAKDAKERTAAVTEKEQLLNAVFATLDDNGKIHLDNIVLPEGFKESEASDNVFIGLSGKEYEVSKTTGAINEINEKDLGEYYLNLLKTAHGLVEGTTEEQAEAAYNELDEIDEQRLVYGFTYSPDDGDHNMDYIQINGYNYYAYTDETGDETIATISLLTKGSDESNKVNSLVEESKSVENELNTLLIGTGYTYTNDDWENQTTATYIANNLSETRTIKSGWNNGTIDLKIVSNIDNRYTLRYRVHSTGSGTYTPQSIENNNIDIF